MPNRKNGTQYDPKMIEAGKGKGKYGKGGWQQKGGWGPYPGGFNQKGKGKGEKKLEHKDNKIVKK